jgi:diguanylate cyclase
MRPQTTESRLIEGTHQILIALARLPEVRGQNAAACSALFADLLKPYPYYSNLGVARPNGDLFCSAVPFEGVANISDRSYFQRAVDRRGFAPGEYHVGRITGKAVINLGYPDPERWVGKSYPDAPFIKAASSQQEEGTIEGSGLDGTPRLFAFTPLQVGERERVAYAYIGIPRDSAFAKVNQIDTRSLVGFGGVLAFALLATGIGSRMLILHPVKTLLQTMRRLGAGELGARTGLPHTPSEVGQLAAAMDEMAISLEVREAGADHPGGPPRIPRRVPSPSRRRSLPPHPRDRHPVHPTGWEHDRLHGSWTRGHRRQAGHRSDEVTPTGGLGCTSLPVGRGTRRG